MLNSLSLFVGTGQCNGRCKHCAGMPLRKYAPKRDGQIDTELISKTVQDCYEQGARYLSISSSGEPTLSPLSVTKTLELIDSFRPEISFSPINLYSNGIRIGEDPEFCQTYLPKWKQLGLTRFYITVHNLDEKENARVYGLTDYPKLETVVQRIHDHDLLMRANIVLSKNTIGTFRDYTNIISGLLDLGADSISSWPVRNMEDQVDKELAPSERELDLMCTWIQEKELSEKVRLLREDSKVAYKTGQKLTLFPNGVLSNTWCN